MRALTTSLLLFQTLAPAEPPRRHEAQIRRTSFGIPHITARDYAGIGFGEGYAQAEDHLCSIADQIVRARGERSRYFGAGKSDEHLRGDIAMKSLGIAERGRQFVSKQSQDLRDWYEGFAAGYNHYLKERGKENVPGWCKGADWVYPIAAADLASYHQVTLLVITQLAPMIATAAPPTAKLPSGARLEIQSPDLASNGWGIGKDRSAGGGGMLLANPHYPWVGSNRFWEKHLTIPGKLDVYGVGLIGGIGVSIGFNRNVAWTHTVSAGKRFTVYSLNLVPGKPDSYRYGNEQREMTRRTVTVDVKQPDGSVRQVNRDVWWSHYGPLLNLPGLGWSEKTAFSVRDANWDNWGGQAQWFDMGRARNMKEFQAAHARHQAMPWINTISTSREGVAWYTDSASTPNLSTEAIQLWRERTASDPLTSRLWQQGMVLLDGSDPRFEWRNDEGARSPGVVAFRNMPRLERTDYLFNANDSFWVANSHALIKGKYSPLHGEQESIRSLRTRNNDLTLSNESPDKPAGGDGKFTLDELGNAILSNRSLAAELFKDDLLGRCRQKPEAGGVNLGEACAVLARWDGRFDVESRGAHVFREFLSQYQAADFQGKGKLYAGAFDAARPTATPAGLAPGDGPLESLAKAVQILRKQRIALDAPLGDLQYADKAGRRMPVHGGDGAIDGLMNMQRNARNTTTLEPMDEQAPVPGSRTLTAKGYPVVHGSSFIMVLEFNGRGPNAKAFLTYGQSGDPKSPHFTDQTELFANKQWRPVLFDEKKIVADVKRAYTVRREN